MTKRADTKRADLPLALSLPLQGTQLIEASAGTGKTWTLALLLVRALVAHDMRCTQVLAITFTRAATSEIRQRVYTLMSKVCLALQGDMSQTQDVAVSSLLAFLEREQVSKALALARTRRALVEFDELSVFTIHGFYQRTLSDNALATGDMLQAGVQTELMPYIEACTLSFWRRELAHHHSLSTSCDKPTAAMLASTLLQYKEKSDKQALLATPLSMAAWVKQLMQRAPQAQVASVQSHETDFMAQLKQCLALLPQRQAALQSLHEAVAYDGMQDMALAVAELVRTKRLPGTIYRKDYVAGWLAAIGDWLGNQSEQSGSYEQAPEKLFTHFTTEALQSALKDGSTHMPSLLSRFAQACDAWVEHELAWQPQLRALHTRMCAWLYAHVAHALPARLAEQGLRSADGLAQALVQALDSKDSSRGTTVAASLRARYALVLVDEFQDTDATQWAVLQRVFHDGGTPLLLVGDPKQAIYRFRGADLATYLRARSQAQATHALKVNQRSTPALISVFNKLFAGEGARGSFGDEGIAYVPITAARPADSQASTGAFDVLEFAAEGNLAQQKQQAAQATASQVQALLQHYAPGKIAVLVPSNEDIALVARSLSQAGIAAAAQRRTQGIAQSFEALQLLWLLQALSRPLDVGKRCRVLITPLWGTATADDTSQQLQAAALWEPAFIAWAALARSRGPAAALEAVMRDRGTVMRWLTQANAAQLGEAEQALARLRQVAEVVQQFNAHSSLDDACDFLQRWHHGGGDAQRYAHDKALGLHDALQSDIRRDNNQSVPRLTSDRAAVTVMTVHGSKGLEFDAVVLPLMWAGKVREQPSEILSDNNGSKQWDFGPQFSAQALAQHEAEEAGESRRVAYVALTRARDTCCVLWPAQAQHSDAAQDKQAAAKTSQTRVDASALQVLLGLRSWVNVGAALQVYSSNKSVIVHNIKDENKYTDNSINKILTASAFANVPWPSVPPAWQTMSFSRWQRFSSEGREVDTDTIAPVADRDAQSADEAATLATSSSVTPQTATHTQPLLRYSFARGPVAGRALHSLLERLDFADTQSAKAQQALAQWLGLHGLADEVNLAVLQAWLHDILHARFDVNPSSDTPPLSLRAMAQAPQQREWEFHLPLTHAVGGALLRDALLETCCTSLQGAAASLPLGYFTGFVDALFEHQGRFYVVDYKSNHLGDSPEHYDTAALAAEVGKHQYDVQAVFYLLALHRHLEACLPGYKPAQHLGGVSLLFLRGMHAGQHRGVWQLPLNINGLLALDALLSGQAF